MGLFRGVAQKNLGVGISGSPVIWADFYVSLGFYNKNRFIWEGDWKRKHPINVPTAFYRVMIIVHLVALFTERLSCHLHWRRHRFQMQCSYYTGIPYTRSHKFQNLPPDVPRLYKLISLLCFLTWYTLFISPIHQWRRREFVMGFRLSRKFSEFTLFRLTSTQKCSFHPPKFF